MLCVCVRVSGCGQGRQWYSDEGSGNISSHALELLLSEQVGGQTAKQTFTPLPASVNAFGFVTSPRRQLQTFGTGGTSVTRSSRCREESSSSSAGSTAGLLLRKKVSTLSLNAQMCLLKAVGDWEGMCSPPTLSAVAEQSRRADAI